jgi:hypothetical protein
MYQQYYAQTNIPETAYYQPPNTSYIPDPYYDKGAAYATHQRY